MPGFNTIAWFEVGTDDPTAAERFYGDLFGWTIARDDASSPDGAYQTFSTGDGEGMSGGLFNTAGQLPSYAVFAVIVADVEATCRRAQEAGGKVLRGTQVTPDGLAFAHLLDPAGNHFEVFTPPPVG